MNNQLNEEQKFRILNELGRVRIEIFVERLWDKWAPIFYTKLEFETIIKSSENLEEKIFYTALRVKRIYEREDNKNSLIDLKNYKIKLMDYIFDTYLDFLPLKLIKNKKEISKEDKTINENFIKLALTDNLKLRDIYSYYCFHNFHKQEQLSEFIRSFGQLSIDYPKRFIDLCKQGISDEVNIIRQIIAHNLGLIVKLDRDLYVNLYKKAISDNESDISRAAAVSLAAFAPLDPDVFTATFETQLGILTGYNGLKPLTDNRKNLIDIDDEINLDAIKRGTFHSLEYLYLLSEEEVVPQIQNTEYEFLKEYLNSKYIFEEKNNLKEEAQITEELKNLIKKENKYKKARKVLEKGQARDLDELIECSEFSANKGDLFLKILGSGVSGTTYKVYCTDLNKERAIKVLKEEIPTQEAKLLAELDHPNIVKVYYSGKNFVTRNRKPVYAILMEYVEGKTLAEVMKENPKGIKEYDRVDSYFLQLSAVVNYLMSKSVTHGDLNLNNIIITKNKIDNLNFNLEDIHRVERIEDKYEYLISLRGIKNPEFIKIFDFGIAKKDQTKDLENNRRYGGENDLQSLGQIMYKIITGKNLFNATEDVTNTKIADTIKEERKRIYNDSKLFNEKLEEIEENTKEFPNLVKPLFLIKNKEEYQAFLKEKIFWINQNYFGHEL